MLEGIRPFNIFADLLLNACSGYIFPPVLISMYDI